MVDTAVSFCSLKWIVLKRCVQLVNAITQMRLSYYILRENNSPTYTGAKEARLILEEEIEPLAIYVYRIPKMRINNPEI